jgi:hypothetical protein
MLRAASTAPDKNAHFAGPVAHELDRNLDHSLAAGGVDLETANF